MFCTSLVPHLWYLWYICLNVPHFCGTFSIDQKKLLEESGPLDQCLATACFLIIPCLGLMYQLTLKTLVNSYSNYRSFNMLLIIHLTLPFQTTVNINSLYFQLYLSCNMSYWRLKVEGWRLHVEGWRLNLSKDLSDMWISCYFSLDWTT